MPTYAPTWCQMALELASNNNNRKAPVIITVTITMPGESQFQLYSTDIGGLFIDGMGDGIWINKKIVVPAFAIQSLGILQATRMRISKTESYPAQAVVVPFSDLRWKPPKNTHHVPTILRHKIGIMGCIVNGPGEMADADYGYVGTGPDGAKISLYKGRKW